MVRDIVMVLFELGKIALEHYVGIKLATSLHHT